MYYVTYFDWLIGAKRQLYICWKGAWILRDTIAWLVYYHAFDFGCELYHLFDSYNNYNGTIDKSKSQSTNQYIEN